MKKEPCLERVCPWFERMETLSLSDRSWKGLPKDSAQTGAEDVQALRQSVTRKGQFHGVTGLLARARRIRTQLHSEKWVFSRESSRVVIEIPITISGIDEDGHIFREETRTLDVSRRGAKIAASNLHAVGTYLWVEGPSIAKPTVARVVRHGTQNQANGAQEICVTLPDLDAAESIWGIKTPPQDWQTGSVTPTAAKRLERLYARDWAAKFESLSHAPAPPPEVAKSVEPQPEATPASVHPNEPPLPQTQLAERLVFVMSQEEKPVQISASTVVRTEEKTLSSAAQTREVPASDIEERLKRVSLAMESLEGRVRELAENFQGQMERSLQASRENGARQAEDLEKIAKDLGERWSQQFQQQAEAQLTSLAEQKLASLSQATRDELGQQLAQAIQERTQEIHTAAEGEVKSVKQAAEEAIAQLQLAEQKRQTSLLAQAGAAEERLAGISSAVEALHQRVGALVDDFQGKHAKQAEDLERIAQELGGQWSQQFQEQAEAAVERLREEAKNSGQAVEESKQQLASLAEEKLATLSQATRDEYGQQLTQAFQERAQEIHVAAEGEVKSIKQAAEEAIAQLQSKFEQQAEAAVERLREEAGNSGRAVEESKQLLASLVEAKLASLSQTDGDNYGQQLAQAFQERAQQIHAAAEGEVKSVKQAAEEAIAQLQSKFEQQAEAAVERLREEVQDSGRAVEESKRQLAGLAAAGLASLSQATRDEYGQQLAQAFQEQAQGLEKIAQELGGRWLQQFQEQAQGLEKIAQELGGRWSQQFREQAEAAVERLREEAKNSGRTVEESKQQLASLAEEKLATLSQATRDEYSQQLTQAFQERAQGLEKIAQELGGRWSQQFQEQAEAAVERLREEARNSGQAVEESKQQLASLAEEKLASLSQATRDELGQQLVQAIQERTQEIHTAAEGEVKSIKQAAEEAIAQLQGKFQQQAEVALERLREEVKNSGQAVEEGKQLLASLAEGKPGPLSQATRDEYTQQLAQAVRERAQEIHAAAEGEVKSIKQAAEEAIAQLQLAEQKRETSFLAQASTAEQRLTGVSLALDALVGELEGKHVKQADELKKIVQELGARFSQQCQKQAEAAAEKLRAEMKNSGRVVEEVKRQLAGVADAKLATFSRVAANAAAGLEAEQRQLKQQYEASRKELETLVARRLAKFSAGSINFLTPSRGPGIAVKLALVAGLFLLMVASLLGVSLSTTHAVIQLQNDPPAEFIDDNPSYNAKRRAREEDVAQAFWRTAVMDLQERYPFGSQLPFDPPDEFQIDKKYAPTGGSKALADMRSLYWDKLRDMWGQRRFWVESQEADSGFGARLRRIWDAIKGKPA